MSASARSGSTSPTTRKSSTTGRHTACSASAQTSGSGRKPGSQGGLKPLPLGRAIPGAPGLFSRSCVIRSFVRGGSVLVLALALGACALTLDSTHLGVPVSLAGAAQDRKSTRLNSSHDQISYAVFCLKKKKKKYEISTECCT